MSLSPGAPSIGKAGVVLLAVTWVFFAISAIVVCLRLYADIFIVRLIRIDSYLTFLTFVRLAHYPSLVFFFFFFKFLKKRRKNKKRIVIVSQTFTQISVHYGMGTHIAELTPRLIVLALKYCWVAQPFQLLAVAFGKLAAVTYLATIKGPRYAKVQLAFLWIVGVSQWIITIALLGVIYGQCSPVAKLWDIGLLGTCDGRKRNVDMAYFEGCERKPTFMSQVAKLLINRSSVGLFEYLHCPLPDFDLLELADEDGEEDRLVSSFWVGCDVRVL